MPHMPCTHDTTHALRTSHHTQAEDEGSSIPGSRRQEEAAGGSRRQQEAGGGRRRHKKRQRGSNAEELGKKEIGQTVFVLADACGSQKQVVTRTENALRLLKKVVELRVVG